MNLKKKTWRYSRISHYKRKLARALYLEHKKECFLVWTLISDE
jgi:ribosomal protein L29